MKELDQEKHQREHTDTELGLRVGKTKQTIRKQNPQTGGRDDDQTWDCGEAAVAGKSRFQVRSH